MHPAQTVHMYEAGRHAIAHESRRPAAGIVFVPCGICLAPVDLAVVSRTGEPPRCERHAAGAPHLS